MNSSKNKIAAFSLPEMLVVLIIMGILFLLVMDGTALFIQFAQKKSNTIAENGKFYDGYYKLNDLIVSADSLKMNGNNQLYIYRSIPGYLHISKSCLLFSFANEKTDTLLNTKVIKLAYKQALFENNEYLDSVFVNIQQDSLKVLNLYFVHKPSEKEILRQKWMNLEKKYQYED